jgi:uncharacterized protein
MKTKLKRFLTSFLPVAENRRGECNRCGQCCKLPFPCPFLRYDAQGLSSCAVYFARPPSCRKYPRTASENLTPQTCGYYFVSPELLRDQVRAGKPQSIPDAAAPVGAAYEQP